MTKEHLLPKSAGGTKIIAVCRGCNQERGNCGWYGPFRDYAKKNPTDWAEAIATSKCHSGARGYITDFGLENISLVALINRVAAPDPTVGFTQKYYF